MKQSVNLYDFHNAFREADRENQFSYEGREALFEYLECYEEDTGEEIELDVISLCCDYEEYENVAEYLEYYTESCADIKREDFDDEEEFIETVKEDIQNNTTLIEIEDSDGFIIEQY